MLTRKQLWRKCLKMKKINEINNETDEAKFSKIKFLDNQEDDTYKIFYDKRHVEFKQEVKVVLIPERIEFKNASLTETLWYKDTDYIEFRQNYCNELKKKYNSI